MKLPCLFASLTTIFLLASCATTAQKQTSLIESTSFRSVPLETAQSAPKEVIGKKVRWGGRVTSLKNFKKVTRIEVIEMPLTKQGKPMLRAASEGRFIIEIDGFADPVIYHEGVAITVVGTIKSYEKHNIGDYRYSFPIVKMDEHKVWSEAPAVPLSRYEDPFPYGLYYNSLYYRGQGRIPTNKYPVQRY